MLIPKRPNTEFPISFSFRGIKKRLGFISMAPSKSMQIPTLKIKKSYSYVSSVRETTDKGPLGQTLQMKIITTPTGNHLA